MSRAVLSMLLLTAGCIAAEPPGKEAESASQRKACSELEGHAFASNGVQVAFAADDAEYSTYTVTAADGTQSLGLAQCVFAGSRGVIYVDGATDHWAARAELGSELQLVWLDGRTLTAAR